MDESLNTDTQNVSTRHAEGGESSLRFGVHRARQLLGTVRLVEDVVCQCLQVGQVRASRARRVSVHS